MKVNLEYYRTFYCAAKEGSVTAAAKKLSVSQPAVSQALHSLEESCGVVLFKRTVRGVKLTREGELLYTYVSKGIESIETGEKMLERMQSLDIGEVHIGASDMTLHFFLLPYLERFHEQYPGIRVTVNNAPTPETLEYLEQGSIDFGVVSGPLGSRKGVEKLPVRRIRDIFVAGEKFAMLSNRELALKQLEELPLIFLEENTSTRRYMDSVFDRYHIRVAPEFELATSDMIVQFALRNLGIGCVVADFAREEIGKGNLFELSFTKKIPEREFYVVWAKDIPLPAAAMKLLSMIRKKTGKESTGTGNPDD